MTIEELKEHCEKQIEMCEFWAIGKGEKPSGKVYEEHKLILKLIEQAKFMNKPCISAGVCEHDKMQMLDKVRAEIEEIKPNNPNFKGYFEQNVALNKVLQIIDKYRNGEQK